MHPRPTEYFKPEREIDIQVPAHVVVVHFQGRLNEGVRAGTGLHSEAEMEVKNPKNAFIEVGVGDHNIGENLYTENVASCQAVVVRFTNGEFRLYHARSPYTVYLIKDKETGEFVTEVNDEFDAFRKAVIQKQIEVEEVIIYEKTQGNISNQVKTPFLAVGLADHLGVSPEKVKRLQVDDYLSVACIDGKVILAKRDFKLKENQDKNKKEFIVTPEPKRLEKEKHEVGYQQSVKELEEQQQKQAMFLEYKINDLMKSDTQSFESSALQEQLHAASQQLLAYADSREKTFKLFGSKKIDVAMARSIADLMEQVSLKTSSDLDLKSKQTELLAKVTNALQSKKTDPTLKDLLQPISQLLQKLVQNENKPQNAAPALKLT